MTQHFDEQFMSQLEVHCTEAHEIYTTFRKVGFKKAQAFELTLAMVTAHYDMKVGQTYDEE